MTMNNAVDAPVLSVRCLAYNHEKFIRQTLEGFVMQRTDFPFEVIVHDDASTDGTVDIIREYAGKYPGIIKPVYQTENQYSKKNGSVTKAVREVTHPNARYIALCEGDDYWTDPYKLQKQVDYLENHPACGMVHTRARIYDNTNGDFTDGTLGTEENTFCSLLRECRIAALTTCFRRELYDEYMDVVHPEKRGWMMGDYPLWLWLAHKSEIGFIGDVTAVYRVCSESASHSADNSRMMEFVFNAYDVADFYATEFLEGRKAWRNFVNWRFINLYYTIHEYGVGKDGFLSRFKKYFPMLSLKNKMRFVCIMLFFR